MCFILVVICSFVYFNQDSSKSYSISPEADIPTFTNVFVMHIYSIGFITFNRKRTESVYFMEMIGMKENGERATHGVMPFNGRNPSEALAGYLPFHKTFVVCRGFRVWRPACLYIPDVSTNN